MSLRSRVCAAPGHPPRPHPACSGCGCHCHPGRPIPNDFRDRVQAARDKARERKTDQLAPQEDTPDE